MKRETLYIKQAIINFNHFKLIILRSFIHKKYIYFKYIFLKKTNLCMYYIIHYLKKIHFFILIFSL